MTNFRVSQPAEAGRSSKNAYAKPRIAAAGRVEDLTRGVTARWSEFFAPQEPVLWNPWANNQGGS